MSVRARTRLIPAAIVVAFLVAFGVVGIVARSTTTVSCNAPTTTTPGQLTPSGSAWYWTMVVAPSSTDQLVVGTNDGMFCSADGGKLWQAVGPTGVNATSLVDVGHTILMGGARISSPDASAISEVDGNRVATNGATVLAISSDGGVTWQTLSPPGLPKTTAIQALAVDPADSQNLEALLNTGALYRSLNGGKSFELIRAKLGTAPWALAITSAGSSVAGDMNTGSYVAGSMSSGSSVSPNAASWQRTAFKDAEGGRMVMEYAVDPNDVARIAMTAYGIVLSTDAGKTWHPALKSKVMFGPIAYAPGSSGIAYAIGFDGSVWHSTNAGVSWAQVT